MEKGRKKNPRRKDDFPPAGHQPSRKELEEPIKINVPGKTVKEQMEQLAKAVTRTRKK